MYFEEVEIGTIRTAGPLLVTKDEIIQFAKQYDPAPRHLDEEGAARSVFGGLTASSAHTFRSPFCWRAGFSRDSMSLREWAGMSSDCRKLYARVTSSISKRPSWRCVSRNLNPIGESFATGFTCVTRGVRWC
jgi:hypothetical protein